MPDDTVTEYPQHKLAKSILLHILPGILVTIVFILLQTVFASSSYPSLLAFLLAVLFVDIPVMLGIMLFEGKKLNGRFSLDGVVFSREKVTWKKFAIVFVGVF